MTALQAPSSQVSSPLRTTSFYKQRANTISEGDKSITQKASDATSGTGTGSGQQGETIAQQASNMAANAAETVKDTLGLNQRKQ